ncbi:hypothetical protein OROHE_015528 [Orobanche hederae]
MGKQFIIFVLFCIAIMAQANGFANDDWFQNILNRKEKVTQLQVYVQDVGKKHQIRHNENAETSLDNYPQFFDCNFEVADE